MSESGRMEPKTAQTIVRTVPTEDPAPTPPLVIVKPAVSSDEESDVLPGSWPKEEEALSQVNSLAVEADVSDAASAHSNHVNDRIVDHFRELEKEKQTAAAIGLGLGEYGNNEMSHVTPTELYQGQGPMIINHTELTPILESSPRESMASESASPRLVSVKSRSSEDRSPPSTRHSGHSAKGVGSPVMSIHSTGDRARSSSLTSQAERLRSKFMHRNGKMSPDKDLTVDTVAADPAKMERQMKFESLIRSGETMKLTLTPTTLRTIEALSISELSHCRPIILPGNMLREKIVLYLKKSANKLRRIRHASCLIFSVPPVRNPSSEALLTNDVVHYRPTSSKRPLPKPYEACRLLLLFGMERGL